jgi:hypothetical protein
MNVNRLRKYVYEVVLMLKVQCVRKVAAHLQKVLKVISMSVDTDSAA